MWLEEFNLLLLYDMGQDFPVREVGVRLRSVLKQLPQRHTQGPEKEQQMTLRSNNYFKADFLRK